MSRESSPYIAGEFWLDKRRDGKAPNVWQIARTDRGTIIYRSTRTGDLANAKASLDAHLFEVRSLGRQEANEANVIAHLVNYWREKGSKAVNSDQTDRSLRTFSAFLAQDRSGVGAVITDLTPVLFERFREWRMGPHAFNLEWFGETFDYQSDGVAGATVQRNVNDIRAAVHHAEANLRIPMAPRIGDLDPRYSSAPRERVLTMDEMVSIAWYASHNIRLFRYVAIQFATASRPDVIKKFDAALQYDDALGLIDLHPGALPQTKKRNALVPAIKPMRTVLRTWAASGQPIGSTRTAWRIMRRTLGLSSDVYPKTIRHTVATILYSDPTVPEREIVELLGHDGKLARTTRIYAKYDPTRLTNAVRCLTMLWRDIQRQAKAYSSDHELTTKGFKGKLTVAQRGKEC